jgi:hypothetical protein
VRARKTRRWREPAFQAFIHAPPEIPQLSIDIAMDDGLTEMVRKTTRGYVRPRRGRFVTSLKPRYLQLQARSLARIDIAPRISGLQPPTTAALVADDGARYPVAGVTLVSGPHVLYNPPPVIGLGMGGVGLSGCCSGFGSDVGTGVPGRPPNPCRDQRPIRGISPDTGAPRLRQQVE